MTMASPEWWKDEKTFEAIRDFSLLQGILKKSSSDPSDLNVTNLSVTLTPFHLPEELFSHACSIQTSINHLMDAVSRDQHFLSSVLNSVVSADDFTRRLLEIYKKVARDSKQTCAFSIQRSDYMIDQRGTAPVLRQIEMNTIAASCFGLTQDKLEALMRFVATRFLSSEEDLNIPHNRCLDVLTEGMAQAWKEYGNPKACILLVHEKGEANIYDSRPIEFLLWKKSDQEVAVVYFRTAYSPDQYHTEKDWDARLLCEMSRASNCPSVGYQLAGTKKVQQALATPGTLEKYISDPDVAAKIRATFAGLYSLEMGAEGDQAIDMALCNPANFVLKPQREGGGNNYYDDDVRIVLESIQSSPEREAYILMDRVKPPLQQGYVLMSGEHSVKQVELSCELGILGVFVRKGSKEVMNKEGGYILRSKSNNTKEAGVSTGFGALDLPSLIPSQQ